MVAVTDDWTQISDSELRAKLEQRGLTPESAWTLVRLRELPDAVDAIDRILGVER